MNNNQMNEVEKKEYILLQNNKLVKFIKSSNKDKIIKCIKNGADVNANFNIPLKQAILSNNIEVIKILLDNGAIMNSEKDNILRFALNNHNVSIALFLIEQGADLNQESLICHFIERGDTKIVLFLLEEGIDISLNNYSCFSKAIEVGNLNIIKHLINKGAKLEEDKNGPLLTAIRREIILEESKEIENYIKKDPSELTMHVLKISSKYKLDYRYLRNKCEDSEGNEINILNYLIENERIDISKLENNMLIPEDLKKILVNKVLHKKLEEELINESLNNKKMKL